MSQQSKLASSYQQNYTAGRKQTVHRGDYALRYLARQMQELPMNTPILDAGCGNGRYARALHSNGYKNVSAFDLFATGIEGVECREGNMEAIPFDDSQFGFVYSLSVLFYVENLAGAMTELNRVLRPGGTLVFSVFVASSPASNWRRLKRALGLDNRYHIGDMNFHSLAYYEQTLAQQGFDVLDANGYFLPQYVQLLHLLEHRGLPVGWMPLLPLSRGRHLSRFKARYGYHGLITAVKE